MLKEIIRDGINIQEASDEILFRLRQEFLGAEFDLGKLKANGLEPRYPDIEFLFGFKDAKGERCPLDLDFSPSGRLGYMIYPNSRFGSYPCPTEFPLNETEVRQMLDDSLIEKPVGTLELFEECVKAVPSLGRCDVLLQLEMLRSEIESRLSEKMEAATMILVGGLRGKYAGNRPEMQAVAAILAFEYRLFPESLAFLRRALESNESSLRYWNTLSHALQRLEFKRFAFMAGVKACDAEPEGGAWGKFEFGEDDILRRSIVFNKID